MSCLPDVSLPVYPRNSVVGPPIVLMKGTGTIQTRSPGSLIEQKSISRSFRGEMMCYIPQFLWSWCQVTIRLLKSLRSRGDIKILTYRRNICLERPSHYHIWFNSMTLAKTRTTAWKDCWRQERLMTLGKTRLCRPSGQYWPVSSNWCRHWQFASSAGNTLNVSLSFTYSRLYCVIGRTFNQGFRTGENSRVKEWWWSSPRGFYRVAVSLLVLRIISLGCIRKITWCFWLAYAPVGTRMLSPTQEHLLLVQWLWRAMRLSLWIVMSRNIVSLLLGNYGYKSV